MRLLCAITYDLSSLGDRLGRRYLRSVVISVGGCIDVLARSGSLLFLILQKLRCFDFAE